MEMKRGLQKREKKHLSAKWLLLDARVKFEKIPTNRTDPRGNKRNISLADSLMSALAMFSLKSPSLLAFDQARRDKIISHNLKSLYCVKQAPCDTYMREQLDDVDPVVLRDCFLTIFKATQRNKLLEQYRFLVGYLVVTDVTKLFSSEQVHCEIC